MSSARPAPRCGSGSADAACTASWMRAVQVGAMAHRIGLPKRSRKASPTGTEATSLQSTASIITSRSVNTASRRTASPTPSASSAAKALGPSCRPAPISPMAALCSSSSTAMPEPRQRQRRRHAADAAADQQHGGLCVGCRAHDVCLRCRDDQSTRTAIDSSPSMRTLIVWPGFTAPTPSGVPVKIRSPGCSANSVDRLAIDLAHRPDQVADVALLADFAVDFEHDRAVRRLAASPRAAAPGRSGAE